MTVYLGDQGYVTLRRQGEEIHCNLEAGDVNVDQRRFSVAFTSPAGESRPSPLITGDQVSFTRTDQSNLVLISGVTTNSVTRWVNVDQVGGLRLYTSYELAVNGGRENAETLVADTDDQDITIDVVNFRYECLAQMKEWEITTDRQTVDTTILGEEYRQFYDQGLISGQGTIKAIWDYKYSLCDDDCPPNAELANYYAQLVIRFREGARFKAIFVIYYQKDSSVWYEADCICTSVGMGFAPGQTIDSTIQFVTTRQIALKIGNPPGYLLQQNDGELLLEQPPGSIELEFDV